jgi:hypothetical protein
MVRGRRVYRASALEDDDVIEALPVTSGEQSAELAGLTGVCTYFFSDAADAIAGVAALTQPRRAAKELGLEAEARFCCCTGMLACKRVYLCVLRGPESGSDWCLLRAWVTLMERRG